MTQAVYSSFQALSVDEPPSSTWDIFQQYSEQREELNGSNDPPTDYWTLTAISPKSGAGRFPTTFDELERSPLPPIDSPHPRSFAFRAFADKKNRETAEPVPSLKAQQRADVILPMQIVEKKEKSESKVGKSKSKLVGKILSQFTSKDNSSKRSTRENQDPEEFHFTMSPAAAHVDRMRRQKAQREDSDDSFFPKPLPTISLPRMERPLSSPPPILETLMAQHSSGMVKHMTSASLGQIPAMPLSTRLPMTGTSGRAPINGRYTPFAGMPSSAHRVHFAPVVGDKPVPF